jgi:hypothetical protein
MQRFMAEVSSPVDKAEFERSWHSDPTLSHEPSVEFVFVGKTVSAVVHSDFAGQWAERRQSPVSGIPQCLCRVFMSRQRTFIITRNTATFPKGPFS